MYYAQIDENGIVNGLSELSGEVNDPLMIPIEEIDISLLGKKYEDGIFAEVEKEGPAMPLPTDEEIIQAEILLNQQEILINQREQDEALAAILLMVAG